jgi:xylulokinase
VTTLVGLDVGTTGVKALALSEDGAVVGRAEEGYGLSTPRPGWAEQDPDDWVRAAESALGQLGAEDTRLGLSGQMHGLVALDAERRVLRPAILWNDQRTGAECAEIEERLGLARLIELTGNRALPGFTAPKLLWLRRHEPDVFDRIAHVLLPKDYVRLRLVGELATDVTDASGTLLFDVAQRRWSDEVLDALELPREWLPPAPESPEVAGAGDQAAGAVGVGVHSPGPVSVVLGTSGVVFAPLERFAADPAGSAHVFCHALPETWHAMGVMLSAAGSLRWFRHLFAPKAPYDRLDAEAAASDPGADGLLFAPYLAGERTPHADPDARGAFVGLTLRHDRGALVRAVLEGVAYGLRDSLELLRGLGCAAEAGRASGGGARSELWLRIVASVLGLPLQRTAVEEGAAYGAALLAGVASGVYRDVPEAVEACVRVRDEIEPDPEWEQIYAEGYERFRYLYPALRPVGVNQSHNALT